MNNIGNERLNKKHDNKKKSYEIFYLLLEIIGIIFIVYMVYTSYSKTVLPDLEAIKLRGSEKYCFANIKMYENSLIMYEIDNPPSNNKEKTAICSSGKVENFTKYARILQSGGYFCRLLSCPITGKVDSYQVSRDNKSVLFVECEIHGSLSMPLVKR